MGCQSITRLPPSRWQFTGFSWVERGMVRVKCFSQEHNWSWTQTSRPADQRNDHQPTVSPIYDENEFDVFCCLSFHPEHRQLAAQLARCRFCFENPDIAKHLIIAIGLKVGWAVCYFRLIPVHPNISIHILLALLYTFPLLLPRRIGRERDRESELLRWVIVFFILMIVMNDSAVLLWGESRRWSLLGFKELR